MYLLAAITYIAMGFLVKQVFAWWWFGAIWLVGFVHFAPRVSAWARARFRFTKEQVAGGET
jgi:hypothetical protein